MTCDRCGVEYVLNGHRPGSAYCLNMTIMSLKAALAFAKAEHERMEREVMMARGCLERLRECYTEDLRHQQGLIDKLEEIVKLVPK